jgi:NodT family efflux transporter outer membrane factor (OMF) lipoprotein
MNRAQPKCIGKSAARSAFRALGVTLAACLLAGCAVGPDYKTPDVSVPGRWGEGEKAQSVKPQLSNWWRRLHDPILNALVDDAVAGNLDVATAKARIREARSTYRQAVGALFPTLTAPVSVTRGYNGTGVSSSGSQNVAGGYTQFQAGFDASWELDLFGGNRRGVEAAADNADAADEDLRSTLLTLIGDVASNYVAARGYQERSALASRTAASQRQTAALTQAKFAAGAASAVDVSNASGLAASTEANIPTLDASYAEAVHRLSVLTGSAPTALAPLLKRSAKTPAPPSAVALGIPADILLARPDVRKAERQLAQYTAKIGQAEANRYPSVSLTGTIASTGSRLGDLAKNSSISWSFGPSLSVPIFNGGQLKAAVEIAEAQRDQHFLAYRSAVLTALEDVENAIVLLAQERVKRTKLAAAAKSYGEAAGLGRALYQSGSSSFLDLLTAERSFYSAEDSLIQSRVAIATDYVALNKALGGGWDGAVDASKPEIVDIDTGPHLATTVLGAPSSSR